jgi:hypothetical protein
MSMEGHVRMTFTGKTEEFGEKPVTLSTINPALTDRDANSGIRG